MNQKRAKRLRKMYREFNENEFKYPNEDRNIKNISFNPFKSGWRKFKKLIK